MSEQTESATARRLQRARDAGNFPRSPLLQRTLVFGVCLCLLPSATVSLWNWGRTRLMDAIDASQMDAAALDSAASSSLSHLVTLSWPLLLVASVASISAHISEARGLIPKNGTWSARHRSYPWARIAQLFTGRTLALHCVQWVTAAILAGYCWYWWRNHAVDVSSTLGQIPKALQLSVIAVTHMAWVTFAIALTLGVIDRLIAYRAWLQGLKLTRAEQRQEHRESEGDPLLKSQRSRLRHEALIESASASPAGATLVIHDHFLVAISLYYDPSEVTVPLVLRVSTGQMARGMIRDCQRLDIAVVQDSALTQALARCNVGAPIAESLYAKVAEILGELAPLSGNA